MSLRWRWRNVPIPEPFVGGLIVGGVLQVVVPWSVLPQGWMGHLAGWPLILMGMVVGSWAVFAAGDVDIERPDRIVTGGPYALSRNPMYVAWALVYLGVTFVVNTVWLPILMPAVLSLIHVAVRREERALGRRFGADFAAYRGRTRRYL